MGCSLRGAGPHTWGGGEARPKGGEDMEEQTGVTPFPLGQGERTRRGDIRAPHVCSRALRSRLSFGGLYGTEPGSFLAARFSASARTILKNASSEYGCSAWSPLGAGANG
jgi:hypothetical protein